MHNQKSCNNLEKIIHGHSLSCKEQNKELIPLWVKDLSLNKTLSRTKNYCQKIANAHTNWYNCCCECSRNSESVYYYDNPRKINFEIQSWALEMILNGFLNECWLSGSTCIEGPARDPLEHYLPNQFKQNWYGTKIYDCHHLETILLPPIESYQSFAPKQHILATDQPKLLLCMVTTCKTICPTNKII